MESNDSEDDFAIDGDEPVAAAHAAAIAAEDFVLDPVARDTPAPPDDMSALPAVDQLDVEDYFDSAPLPIAPDVVESDHDYESSSDPIEKAPGTLPTRPGVPRDER